MSTPIVAMSTPIVAMFTPGSALTSGLGAAAVRAGRCAAVRAPRLARPPGGTLAARHLDAADAGGIRLPLRCLRREGGRAVAGAVLRRRLRAPRERTPALHAAPHLPRQGPPGE
eukprot:870127-Pyramimonas_sp.AAC.1